MCQSTIYLQSTAEKDGGKEEVFKLSQPVAQHADEP